MRILVIYGNVDLMLKARPIFEREDHRFVFVEDKNIDFNNFLDYDIIFSLHCKKVFPKALVQNKRCINIHPGYNPYNRGMFPHVWSIVNGLPAGVTIHEMDEKIDNGKILARMAVPVSLYDTSETLYDRVIEMELFILGQRLKDIIENKIEGFQPEEGGNYNSMADFKKLCEFDLREHEKTYNVLRALTHGEYKNAKLGTRYLKLEII